MVRIINGEIVQDNDPRVRDLRNRENNRIGSNQSGSRIRDLHTPPSPENHGGPQTSRPNSSTVAPGPLDKVSEALGIKVSDIFEYFLCLINSRERLSQFLQLPN
jgi:hypothetical protein